jgi:ribonuclease P protein component
VGSRNLALFGLPNDVGQCRLGITATRKVGGAVRRNRVKRVLREVYRRNRAALGEAVDVVVNAHPGIHERSYAEIEREFLDAFARLARRIR